jgi:hypothetical protein
MERGPEWLMRIALRKKYLRYCAMVTQAKEKTTMRLCGTVTNLGNFRNGTLKNSTA